MKSREEQNGESRAEQSRKNSEQFTGTKNGKKKSKYLIRHHVLDKRKTERIKERKRERKN